MSVAERYCMKKYENYVSALKSLRKAPEQDLSNDFIQSGIIDKFELQFELGWKLFKALLAYEGDPVSASGSPRDVLKTAFRVIGQNVCPFWLVFLCGSGRFSCSSCMGGELEVGQNVCPEWPVRPCGTTVE